MLFSLVNHLCREKDYMVALDLLQGDLFERVVVSPGLLSALGRVYLLLGDIQGKMRPGSSRLHEFESTRPPVLLELVDVSHTLLATVLRRARGI